MCQSFAHQNRSCASRNSESQPWFMFDKVSNYLDPAFGLRQKHIRTGWGSHRMRMTSQRRLTACLGKLDRPHENNNQLVKNQQHGGVYLRAHPLGRLNEVLRRTFDAHKVCRNTNFHPSTSQRLPAAAMARTRGGIDRSKWATAGELADRVCELCCGCNAGGTWRALHTF